MLEQSSCLPVYADQTVLSIVMIVTQSYLKTSIFLRSFSRLKMSPTDGSCLASRRQQYRRSKTIANDTERTLWHFFNFQEFKLLSIIVNKQIESFDDCNNIMLTPKRHVNNNSPNHDNQRLKAIKLYFEHCAWSKANT